MAVRMGQPLWPVVPSSLYGAFLAGEAREVRILVITFDASVDGWGAVVRSSPDEKGTEIVGGYCFNAWEGVCGSGSAPCMSSLAGVSAALPALRERVAAEAVRWLGAPLSLDLFATADNALVPRFFSRFPEPLAEGIDALAQPDWGRSCCPHC
jgi:hypothetical protein